MLAHELGEFKLIERIATFFKKPEDITVWIGDDSAEFNLKLPRKLVTVDSFIEGVHFKKEWGYIRRFGKKALTGSASDIASMGGTPRYFLMNAVVPENLELTIFDEFICGISEKASELNMYLLGGNISKGALFEIHFTVLGESELVISRKGASIGDPIYITGQLGGAFAGMKILENTELRISEIPREKLIRRFTEPEGRFAEARKLALTGCISSMIDISDGLIGDLMHILKMNDVGAYIFEKEIQIFDGVEEYAKLAGVEPIDIAVHSGEEYELLFTVKSEKEKEFIEKIGREKIPVRKIGYIKDKPGINGINIKNFKGFSHF